jgi:hypothetical protein
MAFWTSLSLRTLELAFFLSTGRYYLCGRLPPTDVLIYISLWDSNRKFRYAMLLLLSLFLLKHIIVVLT